MENLLKMLVGEILAEVVYLHTDTAHLQEGRVGLYQVDTAIELRLVSGRSVLFGWIMDGTGDELLEGLFIGSHEDWVPPLAPLYSADASKSEQWRSRLGSEILAVGCSWQTLSDAPIEGIWSVRLIFEQSGQVVIALGEIVGADRIVYIPDSLVVITDEDRARSYAPLASLGSSWGGIVAGSI